MNAKSDFNTATYTSLCTRKTNSKNLFLSVKMRLTYCKGTEKIRDPFLFNV